MMDTKARWQVYIGIMSESTETKNQRWFNIYVPELSPTHFKDLNPKKLTEIFTYRNLYSNTEEKTTIDVKHTIYAEYFGVMSSHSVPTMYKGMQVLVLNLYHSDKWYWVPLERDDDLKMFEHVRISANNSDYSNKQLPKLKKGENFDLEDVQSRHNAIDDDNTYFLEIDTKYKKHILLHTSSSDGEPYRYGFEIDTTAHTIRMWDEAVNPTDRGGKINTAVNEILIESKQVNPADRGYGRISVRNAAGTSLVLDDVDMNIVVPRNLRIDVLGNVTTTVHGSAETAIHRINTKTVGMTESVTVHGDGEYSWCANKKSTIALNDISTVGVNRTLNVGAQYLITANTYIVNIVTDITLSAVNYTFTLTGMFTGNIKDVVLTVVQNIVLKATNFFNVITKVFSIVAQKFAAAAARLPWR